MKVSQLRQLLAGLPDDHLVILSKDAEGNGFSPLAGWDQAYYEAECTWAGRLVDIESEPDPLSGEPCIVLWPTN